MVDLKKRLANEQAIKQAKMEKRRRHSEFKKPPTREEMSMMFSMMSKHIVSLDNRIITLEKRLNFNERCMELGSPVQRDTKEKAMKDMESVDLFAEEIANQDDPVKMVDMMQRWLETEGTVKFLPYQFIVNKVLVLQPPNDATDEEKTEWIIKYNDVSRRLNVLLMEYVPELRYFLNRSKVIPTNKVEDVSSKEEESGISLKPKVHFNTKHETLN